MFAGTPDTVAAPLRQISDTLHMKSGSEIFRELLHHVQDSHEFEIPGTRIELPHLAPIHIGGVSIDLSITKHVVFLWIAAAIVAAITITAARMNSRRKVPTGFGNLIEVFVIFIRDEVTLANMGTGGLRYLPYLLTTFFFILVMNLMGVIPYGASSTANISVTAGLAIISFIMIQYSAIRAQGLGRYFAHMTGGVHWLLWPIMIPIEILGLFTKNFALCMRLFANMTGGHIVILSFIGLIFLFRSYFIAPASIGFALGVNLLEVFVAFLQAYIFTMLTSLFMGLGILAAHPEQEGHDH